MTDKLRDQLEFLAVADGMKQVFRQTTLLDGSRYENNAEHSWHFALTAMTLFEHCELDGVNIDDVIKMAIIHDLVEIFAGDTPAQDVTANIDKEDRERKAADRLFALLPEEQAYEYRRLWEEFDAMETPDAIYAGAIDRLQALHNIYKSGGRAWSKYHATVERVRGRMLPIEKALPALWPFVEGAIADCVEKGWVQP